MDKDALKERLMATFLGELGEHVRTLEASALTLEKDPGPARADILKTLFRTAHSLKGAARSAGVALIETVCHRLEEILGDTRDGIVPVSADLVQLLLSTADALGDAARRLRAREDLSGSPLGSILARLEGERRGAAPSLAAPAPPTPAPAGAASPTEEGMVRLSAARLDALVSRSGELLVARRRAAQRHDDIAALRDTLGQCVAAWRRLERPLRRLAAPSNGSPTGVRTKANGASTHPPLPPRAVAAIGRTNDRLKKLERDLERLSLGVALDHRVLDQAASPLEDEVRRLRMLPFGEACEGLSRAVRDLAQAAGKEVDLVVEGTEVELDRAILASLRDPLLHLVRNAVDHGIERPGDRQSQGKTARGRITISAALKGGGVEIVVADDGRGLDRDAIREQAHRRKIAVPEDESELLRLVFLPGFSTARLITELSGRGVGLDVVRHGIESVHGGVEVSSRPGLGTRFSLTVPLTLTTLRALLIGAAGQAFAVPAAQVRRLVRAGAPELGVVEGREVLLGEGAPVPVVSLAETLGLPAHDVARVGGKVPLVVLASGEREVAFAVDELLAEQDVVVKGLGRRLRRVRHVAGATILPTGKLSLILAPAELLQTAIGDAPRRAIASQLEEKTEATRKRLLVVDDSVTTRSLEKSILEAAGYDVLSAVDGADAWRILQEKGADLLVADVEMPVMDGFALTEAVRASKRFRDLPVVLVTALETERDKVRGLEAGADAYLPKSAFDQKQLLEVVARLL